MPPYKFPSRTRPASGGYKLHSDSTCVNGIVYWIQYPNGKGDYEIVVFDVMEEKFQGVIPVPEGVPKVSRFELISNPN